MKYNKIILFFGFALPVSMILRFLQLFYIVESDTGFFKQEFNNYGYYIMAVIFAFTAATAVFSFFSHRSPEHPPTVNIGLSLSSFALAVSIVVELFLGGAEFGTIIWQTILLRVFGIASAVWFAAFSIKDFMNLRIPAISFSIPTVYFVLKIICSFAGISSLALISDNILLIGANCVSLLFMLNFAKLYNNIDTERGFRKLLASGLASVILCFTQSVPNIVFHFSTEGGYLHTAMVTNFNVLFTGIFIVAFVFSHFSHSNACE